MKVALPSHSQEKKSNLQYFALCLTSFLSRGRLVFLLGALAALPNIGQAQVAGTAGVTKIYKANDPNQAAVNPPFKKGTTYVVEWSATEKVKDIHLKIDRKTSVDFNDASPGTTENVEINTLGWQGFTAGGKFINILAPTGSAGETSGSFEITINSGPLVTVNQVPIFTRDGKTWPKVVKSGIIPDIAGAPAIPFLAVSASLDVENLIGGAVATAEVTNATPFGIVLVGWSAAGGGPTSTPWGDLLLSSPYTQFPPMIADELGGASYSVAVPPFASGLQIWFHGMDMTTHTFTDAFSIVVG